MWWGGLLGSWAGARVMHLPSQVLLTESLHSHSWEWNFTKILRRQTFCNESTSSVLSELLTGCRRQEKEKGCTSAEHWFCPSAGMGAVGHNCLPQLYWSGFHRETGPDDISNISFSADIYMYVANVLDSIGDMYSEYTGRIYMFSWLWKAHTYFKD